MRLADTKTCGFIRYRQAPRYSGELGTCPLCGAAVLAKCGEIVRWHWAHQSILDCDPWGEPESAWHLAWKDSFPAHLQEIVMGAHRADVRTERGWVLEFQHSPLSVPEIREREAFYGPGLIWIVDGEECSSNFHFRTTPKHGPTLLHHTPVTFRWKWPRQTWRAARRPLFFDLGGDLLLRIHWMSAGTPLGGWGVLTSRPALAEWARTGLNPVRPLGPGERNRLVEERFRQQRGAEWHPYGSYKFAGGHYFDGTFEEDEEFEENEYPEEDEYVRRRQKRYRGMNTF